MSVIDKIIAALTPIPDDTRRLEATQNARAVATDGDWLSLVLDHHERIRQAFSAGKLAKGAADRKTQME